MKLLMEQWRGFLNEKLMLNPGDKASICINTRVGGTYANDDSSCAKEVTGEFPEQKICLLDGFDYYNVGVVNGYKIVDKELVKEDAE
tara:strand:- start:1671 stop:1931 length:261 start_codon:yes stop_codon:yes gene_type:complete